VSKRNGGKDLIGIATTGSDDTLLGQLASFGCRSRKNGISNTQSGIGSNNAEIVSCHRQTRADIAVSVITESLANLLMFTRRCFRTEKIAVPSVVQLAWQQ
jgi:hypothetical protein